MAWGANAKTFRAMSYSHPASPTAAAQPAGPADFSPASIRACSFARPAIRCSICRIPMELTHRFAAILSTRSANSTNSPSAASIKDLKARGLLDRTLVIWGGEFGRNPILQGKFSKTRLGRDHQGAAFSLWMAGGGIRRGFEIGKTDDLGMNVVEDAIQVFD